MAYTPLSAKFAQVRFNTVVVTAKKWSVTPTADKLDVTNFEGNGYANWLAGIYQCDFTVEGDWDSSQTGNEFSSGINFTIGQTIANVKLYTAGISNDGSSGHWCFPYATIFETPMTAAVRETVTFSITCTAQGGFCYPAQSSPQIPVSPGTNLLSGTCS